MTPRIEVRVEVTLPWWTWLFINSCKAFAWAFNLEPDADKIMRTVMLHAVTTVTVTREQS